MVSCTYTHVGGRTVNEDSLQVFQKDESNGLFVVCDGLGGHGRGEVASQIVAERVSEKVKELGIGTENVLENAVSYAQEQLLKAQVEMKADNEMKTTVVCLQVYDGKAQWAHVGDSRLYLFRKKKMQLRTLDHSVPQILVASGEIKEKHIRFHEDRNRLIRVVGTPWDQPKYDVSETIEVMPGDAFLLCTDGFWELITEKEMIKCLKKAKTIEAWMNLMSEIVQKRGDGASMDNNTAIAVII